MMFRCLSLFIHANAPGTLPCLMRSFHCEIPICASENLIDIIPYFCEFFNSCAMDTASFLSIPRRRILCLQHRNHCVVKYMCTNISVPISMIQTIPNPLAQFTHLRYNTNNLPRPCITHDSAGGIYDHRTDHRWPRSERRQRTRECQRAQKPALFRTWKL